MLSAPNEGSLISGREPGEKEDHRGVDHGGSSPTSRITDSDRGRRHRANQKAWREKNKEHVKQYMQRWWAGSDSSAVISRGRLRSVRNGWRFRCFYKKHPG